MFWKSSMNLSHTHYSFLFSAFFGLLPICLGFGLFTILAIIPSIWLWFAILLICLVGVALHITSKRVVYMRIYQVFIVGLMALTYGGLLWAALALHQSFQVRVMVGLLIVVMLAGLAIGGYLNIRQRVDLQHMPFGPVGTMNEKTGVVDPHHQATPVQKQQDELNRLSSVLRRWNPLIAGLSMLLVSGLPSSGIALLIALMALATAVGGAVVTGGWFAPVVACLRWEREHGKHIVVKQ
ncbi:MAG: hypothetical protein WBE17_14765 [Anaerolineae bacterium]